ncbi:hypothetical protein N7472_010971 [Penicillium cf. griseofulvum]|uniref:Uncharacterized protein n=1 Tax=Penicillium cf. griseofulvum TaxID=2972120 RepID=A0A9W9M1J2_9EURO|nr:hypothetical protein N7472_010971 [Penicillium cf. griseofulvum]
MGLWDYGIVGMDLQDLRKWVDSTLFTINIEFADEEAKGAVFLGAGMGVATGSGTGEPIICLAAAARRAVGEAVGAGKDFRTHKALGAGAEQEDTSSIRRSVEAAMRNPDSNAYNEDRASTILVKAAETDRCSCDEGSQMPRYVLM